MSRNVRIVAVCVAIALIALFAVRCERERDAAPPPRATAATPSGAERAAPDTSALEQANLARADADARNARLKNAVGTLHRYLTALGTGDPAKSDPFWSGGKPPRTRNEADLPLLEGLRSLRIENGAPRALDDLPAPESLEIPITLRAGMKGAPARRYEGYYRLRSTLDKQGWELTSARIDAVAAPQ